MKLLKLLSIILLIPQVCFGASSRNYDGGDLIDVGDPGSGILDFGTGSFSFGVWFKSSGTNDIILNKMSASLNQPGFDVLVGAGGVAGNILARVSDNSGGAISSPTFSGTSDSKWHFVIGVVDRSSNLIRIYGDGSEVGSGTSISGEGSVSSTTSFQIGARAGTASYVGDAAYAQIYNKLFNAVNVSQAMFFGECFDSVGCWPQFGDSPELDISGNGNNGTVTGATTSDDGPPVMFGGGLPL